MVYLCIVDEHIEGDFLMLDGDFIYEDDLPEDVIDHLVATAVLVPVGEPKDSED